MSKRLTTRSVLNTSDEFAQIKTQVKQYQEDLFPPRERMTETSLSLIETMGKDKNVVGFIIQKSWIGQYAGYHGYSLITHDIIFGRSREVAIKWVKMQSKNNS